MARTSEVRDYNGLLSGMIGYGMAALMGSWVFIAGTAGYIREKVDEARLRKRNRSKVE